MTIRLLIIACSLITYSLSLNDNLTPRIVYQKYGPPMCNIGNTDCLQPLTSIQLYLRHVINIERSRVAIGYYNSRMLPNATDMLLLEMDKELESKAQTYAETCLIENCLHPEKENPNGEVTISITEHDRNAPQIAEYRVAKTLMIYNLLPPERFSEKEMEELVKSSRFPETENFHVLAKITQADVWKIGCGFADFLIPENKFKEVVVCFFGPPKLKIGKNLYTAGCVPCYNCPGETSCVEAYYPGLCKVNDEKLPVYDTHKIMEETSCLKPAEPSQNPPTEKQTSNTNEGAGENFLWQANKDLSTQQCKGTDLCSSAWIYTNDYASIQVNEKCMSISLFQAEIYIQKDSCFIFYYQKNITKSSTNIASVVVLAFEHQSDLHIKEEKYEKNVEDFKPIYLDLPWNNSYIHVGFGTRSDEEDWYMIEVKNFKIEIGACPQSENNTSQ